MPDTAVAIELEGVSKRFGKAAAVHDVSLAIREGEFFSLLGPSGCGKTTTLRMIAGFEVPDEGRIMLQGRDGTSVSANRRPVNMVFQQYALFPHMSIYDNVAFGLKVKRVPRRDHSERIKEMLRVVELEGLERRRPRQLSGGQQQRVALARALVAGARVVVLDDPMSAVDTETERHLVENLRPALAGRTVLIATQRLSTVEVADRAVVVDDGVIVESGTSKELLAAGGLFASLFGEEVSAAA
jgi:spermidine/putrescine transport system ATP-binding protein